MALPPTTTDYETPPPEAVSFTEPVPFDTAIEDELRAAVATTAPMQDELADTVYDGDDATSDVIYTDPDEEAAKAEEHEDRLTQLIIADEAVIPAFSAISVELNKAAVEYTERTFSGKIEHALADMEENKDGKTFQLTKQARISAASMSPDRALEFLSEQDPDDLQHTSSMKDGELYRSSVARLKPNATARKSDLNHGLRRFRQSLGNATRFPLIHSGIWIELDAPGALDKLTLVAAVQHASNEFAASHGGVYFLHQDVVLKSIFLQKVILPRIRWASVHDYSDLPALISIHDYDALLTMAASLAFPNGYDGFQTCCLNPDCNHTERSVIEPLQLIRHLTRKLERLHPGAAAHMAKAKGSGVSNTEILAYQEAILPKHGRELRIKTVRLKLKTPSLKDTLASGMHYLNTLKNLIQSGSSNDLEAAMQATRHCHLAHWTENIQAYYTAEAAAAGDPGVQGANLVPYVNTAEMRFQQMSDLQALDLQDNIIKAIFDFISASRCTFVGMLSAPCPKCKFDPVANGLNNGFMPVDPTTVFSTCLSIYSAAGKTSDDDFEVITAQA